jgi:zinc metalloprotease ZmpB
MPQGVPLSPSRLAAREMARALLRHAEVALGARVRVEVLRDGPTIEGPRSVSVRFAQHWKGVPVDGGEVVVNFHGDGRLHSVYSHIDEDIAEALDPAQSCLDAVAARQTVARLASVYRRRVIGAPRLIVYRYSGVQRHPPKPSRRRTAHRARFLAAARRKAITAEVGRHFVAWDVRLATERPRHRWRVLVDTVTGGVIEVLDEITYATGSTRIFDPNPIVSSGDPGLSRSSLKSVLDAERLPAPLLRLDPKALDGYLHLDGAWVHMEDFDSPTYAEPRSKKGVFTFSWDNRKFLSAMAYFHIDRFQDYLGEALAMPGVAAFSISADPQGQSGSDASGATADGLSFGEGGVPDASDAMIVLHEYGHAIQNAIQPQSSYRNWSSGVSEGFGDFLAAVYYDDKHVAPHATRGLMFSWDANATDNYWPGRRYDRGWRFDGPEYDAATVAMPDGYKRGEVWCSTMFELYRKLGGDSKDAATRLAARDVAIRLHVAAQFTTPEANTTATEMAQQIQAADHDLAGWRYANGLHGKVIADTFERRGLSGFPAPLVDVYIDDGRDGGYGSPLANPTFADTLWLEPFDSALDVWTMKAQYADTAQAAGTLADHVAPQAGLPAFVYARIKNRGTDPAGSGAIIVRVFHASVPGDWPGVWTPADVPAIQYDNVLPGAAIVAGPFPFTPATADPSVLVVVECARDRSVTQDLPAGALVHIGDLVPFDNNVALRRVSASER